MNLLTTQALCWTQALQPLSTYGRRSSPSSLCQTSSLYKELPSRTILDVPQLVSTAAAVMSKDGGIKLIFSSKSLSNRSVRSWPFRGVNVSYLIAFSSKNCNSFSERASDFLFFSTSIKSSLRSFYIASFTFYAIVANIFINTTLRSLFSVLLLYLLCSLCIKITGYLYLVSLY